MNYLKLAINQFSEMKEEWLDNDRHCVGGISEESYELEGVRFQLKVDGFWEKSDWFDYTVIDTNGNELEKKTYFYS